MYEFGKRSARKFGGNVDQISPLGVEVWQGSKEFSVEVWVCFLGNFRVKVELSPIRVL